MAYVRPGAPSRLDLHGRAVGAREGIILPTLTAGYQVHVPVVW